MGNYATRQDLIDEGAPSGDTDRLDHALELATAYIDIVTGQWFESRALTLTFDGEGQRVLHLPIPVISVTTVTLNEVEILTDSYYVYNRTVPDDRKNPKIVFEFDLTKGHQNVTVQGSFGYVDDPTGTPATPALIGKVCVKLALAEIGQMYTDANRREVIDRGRLIEEETDRHSYKLADLIATGGPTGDPEIDTVLARYRRPIAMGMA